MTALRHRMTQDASFACDESQFDGALPHEADVAIPAILVAGGERDGGGPFIGRESGARRQGVARGLRGQCHALLVERIEQREQRLRLGGGRHSRDRACASGPPPLRVTTRCDHAASSRYFFFDSGRRGAPLAFFPSISVI
jgi:hypothetical protein